MAQGPLWEAARSRGCPPGSLEMLQLDVTDADSIAAARARVTEGRVDVLGESPCKTSAGAFLTLCPNQNVLRPREHEGTGGEEGRARGERSSGSLPPQYVTQAGAWWGRWRHTRRAPWAPCWM